MNFVRQGQPDSAIALVREAAAGNTAGAIRDIATAMQSEEERLLALRTINADRSQLLP